jgi:flagellar protein FliO/FliZ
MQWLNELPFADNRVLQIGLLAACGIAALIVLAIVYRLTFAHRLRVPGGRTRQPRLGLVDAFSLDGQRQLVLIRRDNIEHLVMIGGPNDVLVESQINRAVVPARESNLASPLLVPSAPVRRTEAAALPASPAVPEPPPKVAAKVPASPPAPPPPPPAAQAAPAPAAPVPKAPAPAQPTASVSDQTAVPAQAVVPAQSPAAELARPAPVPPAATQVPEPARPAPANSPPPRQADPRPAQVRATMPPPIIPANASPNRGAPVRATETARGPGNPPGLSPVAPAPPRRPEKAEPAVAGSKAESIAPMAKTEAPAAPTVTTVPPANAGLAQARPAPKTVPLTPASDWARKSADASPPGDKTNAAPSGKPSPKVDDPFADLDSLESEMARLLGREKSD